MGPSEGECETPLSILAFSLDSWLQKIQVVFVVFDAMKQWDLRVLFLNCKIMENLLFYSSLKCTVQGY